MWLSGDDQGHDRYFRRVQPNKGMQRAALRAAADAKRWAAGRGSHSRVTVYELWQSKSEGSYALRYFPDIGDYHVRPLDEQVVWSTNADSFEEAIQKQYEHLEWGTYQVSPVRFDYPPAKRTFLFIYDYGQGGIWVFVDAERAADVIARHPELSVIQQRPPWLTPGHQRRIATEMHFDIEAPSGWLLELEANRS